MSHKAVKVWTHEEILNLVNAVESCSLPRGEWNHQTHLIVALWYLTNYPQSEAINYIREGIQNYNNASGIKTTKNSGYHETLTLFWIKIVSQYLTTEEKNSSFINLANNLIQHRANPRLPLEYYSCDRLMSEEARRSWVEPDLKSLDKRA